MSPVLVGLLGAAAMAVLAVGLWLPAYLRHRQLQRRLLGFVRAGTPGGLAIDTGGRRGARVTPRRESQRNGFVLRTIQRRIIRSHVDVSPGEVLGAMAVLGLVGLVLGSVWWGSVVAGAMAGAVTLTLPILWLDRQHRKVRSRSAAQLLDTLGLLSSSVRSGHSLLQALEHVASEAPEPTRSNFALVVREIGLGAAQDDALERLAERMGSEDFDLVVSAIGVHGQIGGSLTTVLDSIGETVRERVRVSGDIKAITSQQRYSAYVLSALPVVTAGALALISPDYVAVLLEEGGLRIALIVSVVMVIAGFFTMRSLASIDV